MMCAVDVLWASKYLRRGNITTFILSHDVVVFVELCYQRSAKSSADNPSRDGCVQSWHFGRVLRTGRHRCDFIPLQNALLFVVHQKKLQESNGSSSRGEQNNAAPDRQNQQELRGFCY